MHIGNNRSVCYNLPPPLCTKAQVKRRICSVLAIAWRTSACPSRACASLTRGGAPTRHVRRQMSHSLDFFDGYREHARVATSKIFTEEPRVPERKAKESEFKPIVERAFYPARAPRSG